MNNEMTTDNMSNEEVIEVLKGIVFNGFDRTTRKERQALDIAIKSLEERPQGEWIYDSDHSITIDMYKCSICGGYGYEHFKFCHNCGSDMQKGGAK